MASSAASSARGHQFFDNSEDFFSRPRCGSHAQGEICYFSVTARIRLQDPNADREAEGGRSSAASCRGLIEAWQSVLNKTSFPMVIRGFVPRPH